MNVEGSNRREKLLEILDRVESPVSGSKLAKELKVSRQVIVQDIALLRAENKNILATNKGYILYKADTSYSCRETIAVCHEEEGIQDELYTIVDMGGHVLDVVVEHKVYGQIVVDLVIKSRKDVDDFLEQTRKNDSKPLTALTNGVHYHTIEAEKEETMAGIIRKLNEKGYLISHRK